METSTNSPVVSFRLRGLSASVFRNEPQKKGASPFYKVSLQRRYKTGDEFKTTYALGRENLPDAQHLLQQAWEFINEAESRPSGEESGEE